MMWFKWLLIWCFFMYHSNLVDGELTFDPLVTFQPNVATPVNRVLSCKVVSPSDGLTHTYHILVTTNALYRFDELDQTIDSWTLAAQYMEPACYGDFVIGAYAYDLTSPLARFNLREGFIGSTPPDRPDDVVTDLHAAYFGSQRVVLVKALTTIGGVSTPYSYYFSAVNNAQITSDAFKTTNGQQFIPATVLMNNITSLIVTVDNTVLNAAVLSTSQGSRGFVIDLTKQLTDTELFWNPPSFFITNYNAGSYIIYYGNDLNPAATTILNNVAISAKTIMFRSTLYPEWHGALFSLQSFVNGNYLFGFLPNGTLIVNNQLTDFQQIKSELSNQIMSIDQLDEISFVMNQWNGTTLKSIVARVGDGIFFPITLNPPVPLPVPVPVDVTPPTTDDIIVVSFNSTTTVTTLTLTNNSVLVVTNEAVIEVTDCAALAGKLQYVLSESQYNSLLQNDTLNILVLLTQCTNGTFDSTEVIFEGADQACVDLVGEPKPAPGQLTLLVTKSQKDCNSNVVQDPLTTGAIIGIVAGCAAAAVLIIVLSLYFSPMRAKVFPYAPQYKK